MLNYKEQRQLIQNHIDDYFGVEIDIAPRGMIALQGAFSHQFDPEFEEFPFVGDEGVFEGLIKASPAILSLLFDIGITADKLLHKTTYVDEVSELGVLDEGTLDRIFRGIHDDDTGYYLDPCETYNKIIQAKSLNEHDLFNAFIETIYSGNTHFNHKVDEEDIYPFTNILGDRLLKSGLINPESAIEKFDEEFIQYSADSVAAAELNSLKSDLKTASIIDPSHEFVQLALWLDKTGKFKIRPFGTEGIGKDKESIVSSGTSYVLRNNILQPFEHGQLADLHDPILLLEDMINSKNCSELSFQKFFEKYPNFLTGLDYKRVHPQLVLESNSMPNRIPDFFLEPLSTEFCDLLELKLPYQDIVRRTRSFTRVRFKDFIDEAIAQLIEYRRYFEDSINRNNFYNRYGLSAYNPNMILVVGRRHHFKSDIERSELQSLLPKDIKILTYDDVLDRSKRLLSIYEK